MLPRSLFHTLLFHCISSDMIFLGGFLGNLGMSEAKSFLNKLCKRKGCANEKTETSTSALFRFSKCGFGLSFLILHSFL